MSTPISKTSWRTSWDADRALQSAAEPRHQDQIREAFRSLSASAKLMDWSKFGPVGWRFNPSDIELLDYYLRAKKYGGGPICEGIFGDFDLYRYDPQNIPQDKVHRHCNGRMYIFTPIYKLHKNGSKKGKRNTPNGHWKMNSSPIPVIENNDGQTIGTRSSLAFFDGHKRKTRWLMYEFRLVDPPTQADENEGMMDHCVLAVVYRSKEHRVLDSSDEFNSKPKRCHSLVLSDNTGNYSMEQSHKKLKYARDIGGISTSNSKSITSFF
ncbi:NAC domain-containing protein [Salix suchowensis]|nr:NAC domain-containing protein [Salix suchowensis]